VVIFLPVAPDDLPRVRAVLDGSLEPPVPRPAVTVVLARDGARGLEVLLLRRNPRLAFAPGRYVFPGGSADPSDAEVPPWHGTAPAEPLVVTAGVRETFEECGVLLAVDAGGRPAALDPDDASWDLDRVALESASTSLAAVLHRRGLSLDAGMFAPLAHWVTPIAEKRRFDTRFLLAALPEGQFSWEIVGESDLQEWVRPAEALARDLPMLPPTRAMLEELATESSVAEAMARPRTFERIEPGVRLVGDRLELLLPEPPRL
jgi:8-oxo-dGTP pyrophosphatase MutT (NUDIX family)